MYSQLLGDDVFAVSTDRRAKPGELVITNDRTYGTRVWRFVKNDDPAAAFPMGTIIQRKAATVDDMTGIVCVTDAVSRFRVLGVSQCPTTSAWPKGSFAYALKEGIGFILGDGAVSAGDAVCSSNTAGRGRTAVAATLVDQSGVFAFALEADGAAGTTFRGHICCP